jgi:hypothetical protein
MQLGSRLYQLMAAEIQGTPIFVGSLKVTTRREHIEFRGKLRPIVAKPQWLSSRKSREVSRSSMARHKDVPKLYTLVHQWLVEWIGEHIVRAGYDGCNTGATSASALAVSGLLAGCANQAQALSVVKMKIRPHFVETLPASVRATLIEDAANFLLRRSPGSNASWGGPSMSPSSAASPLDSPVDYGRSLLHLLHLLLSKEVRCLKIQLCCYGCCRDNDGVLRCIKKYGGGLEWLELSRSSLLRMDPLLFRNVLTSASHLNTLVVKNICSDSMLKLIGDHCFFLQYLDISGSKQVCQLVGRNDSRSHRGFFYVGFRRGDRMLVLSLRSSRST